MHATTGSVVIHTHACAHTHTPACLCMLS